MAYIVEQKIKGRIYLYRAESYWDKDKKQSRQRRVYLGPKGNEKKAKIKPKKTSLITKNYGHIFLLKFISDKLGLTEIIKSCFPENHIEISALSYYEITEASALYLFPYWLDEQYLPGVKKLHSPDISQLCESLGRLQTKRSDFIQNWVNKLKPVRGIYYDITSISGYSTNIDFIEWGYNRNQEKLPQLNMGVAFCQNNSLPICYHLYPGSIVDVTTLKNCIKYLSSYNLKEILFVSDRGFFSKANVSEMNNNENKLAFIQPLPFSLNQVKTLIKKNKKSLSNIADSFKFHEEILYYQHTVFTLDKEKFNAHIFLNEKAEVEQKHYFLSGLLEIEEKLKNKTCKTLKEYLEWRKSDIPEKYRDYFKWNKTTFQVEKNIKQIRTVINKMGSFILLTNQESLGKVEILNLYRQRDKVEKIFDIVKNEIDGDRLKVHSQYNTEGRLFIKFISLIICSEILNIMKEKDLFKKFSIKETIAELRKLKITQIGNNAPFLSELSKKQKIIFEAFGINENLLHSY
jgi:transposase